MKSKKRKIKSLNSLLCWNVTLLMFTENLALVKTENRLAVYVILEIFWTVLLKTHACFVRFWILNECNLSWKIVKYCILSEVCMIKTAPHITVSPQMWCIKSMKCWFTRTQICWQDFVKYTCRPQKIRPDLFSKNSFSRPDLLWSRAIMALKCGRRWFLYFGCTYTAVNSM